MGEALDDATRRHRYFLSLIGGQNSKDGSSPEKFLLQPGSRSRKRPCNVIRQGANLTLEYNSIEGRRA
jgi:hypothetical protein